MMNIYDIQGNVILSVPVLPEDEKVEELMRSDEIHLFWNTADNAEIPVGAYVEWPESGERYSLIEPYSPTQRTENKWRYEPVFVSAFYGLSKTPFYMYTYEGADVNGKILSREADWVLTDTPSNFMSALCRGILNETGSKYTFAVGADLAASATVTFNSVDIISALNAIANAFDTEFWLEKYASADASGNIGKIHLSYANNGASPKILEVGKNVNVPSVTDGGEGYYNRFVVLGSTRNITQDYQGAASNLGVTKRLTLDPKKYPDGWMDFCLSDPRYTKILTFDGIYPAASDLVIYEVGTRLRYYSDMETGEKLKIDKTRFYPVYYIQLKRKVGDSYVDFKYDDTTYDAKDNPDGMVLPGLVPSIHFNSGPLRGREFEVTYHKEAGQSSPTDEFDVTPFAWKAGDFEIHFVTEGEFTIPALDGLVPGRDDQVVLFNIKMPEAYVEDAQLRLEKAAFKEIGKRFLMIDENGNARSANSAIAYRDKEISE